MNSDLIERTPDLLILQAEQHATQDEFSAAHDAFVAALDMLTQSTPAGARVRALGGLSWTLCKLGASEEAFQRGLEALECQRAAAPDADAPLAVLHRLIGNALMALARFEDAQARYGMARDAQIRHGAGAADRAATLALLGEAAASLGRFDLAEAHLQEAVSLLRTALPDGDPQFVPMLTNLGFAQCRNEKWQDAETTLREALRIDPISLLATDNLITAVYWQGRKSEAYAMAVEKYREKSFVVEHPPSLSRGTLLMIVSTDGMLPPAHLMDGLPLARIKWYVEFSTPAHEAQIPPYDVVFNTIGDVDSGRRAQPAAIDFQRRCPVKLLNEPERIGRTQRHQIAARLSGIDNLVVPKVVPIAATDLIGGDALAVLHAHGFTLPVLLREAGTHGGETVSRIDTEADWLAACAALKPAWDCYITAYHDYASADGLYRKYRAIFIDRTPYPYHLAISQKWLVHYFSADMMDRAERQAEELRYLNNMPEAIGQTAASVLHEVGQRMDLDYCGIDFGLLEDGRVLLFECNATMLVHPEKADSQLAGKNPYIQRIITAFQDMLVRAAEHGKPA